MKTKHLTSIRDLSGAEIMDVLVQTKKLKALSYKGKNPQAMKGKVLAMIFQKPSTRTRVSFETGAFQLGGTAIYLSSHDTQLGRGESVPDSARVLSRFCDIIMARVFGHSDIENLAKYATVPVINGLSDFSHPCQILADLFTIYEKGRKINKNLKVAYIGDGNNITHSWIFAAGKVGFRFVSASPSGYEPLKEVVEEARRDAKKSGAVIEVTNDPVEAAKGADVIYTDTWASMGQEKEHDARVKIFMPYQVNQRLVSSAKKDCLVMHCLPAHRGEEITDEVMDGPNSIVFDEAENRLHVQKTVMIELLKNAVSLRS
ncbi:MAG: ornithine carbamoyltransferase [Planctomycetes bacterium]|nr:ornithine carbamoyltransferase [Planctomycetota bacterium]